MLANHIKCIGCHYRRKTSRDCVLGAVNTAELCPRSRPRRRVVLATGLCCVEVDRPEMSCLEEGERI